MKKIPVLYKPLQTLLVVTSSLAFIGFMAFGTIHAFINKDVFPEQNTIRNGINYWCDPLTNYYVGDQSYYIAEEVIDRSMSIVKILDNIGGIPVTKINLVPEDLNKTKSLIIPTTIKEIWSPRVAIYNHLTLNVFYMGEKEQYKGVSFDHNPPNTINLEIESYLERTYYYSETENTDGHHWHFIDDKPTIW